MTQTTLDADLEVPQRAEEMIDIIRDVEQLGDRTDGVDGVEVQDLWDNPGGRLPTWELPGFADDTMQDDCGEEQPHFCDECGQAFKSGNSCAQSRCPRCWRAWCVDTAEHLVQKLDAVARTRSSEDPENNAYHKHHVGLMLPPDWTPAGGPQERYEATKNAIKEIITDVWDAEGIAVYHGYSGSGYDEVDDPGEDDDRGEWVDRLADDREWEGDVRDELEQRQHFHCVVVAEEGTIPGGQETAAVYRETGWFIRRWADSEGRSIDGMEDLAATVSYCLSHQSIDTSDPERNNNRNHRFGSTWHDNDLYIPESTEREAKRAVRSEAPRTLGIPEKTISCDGEIAPERAADGEEHYTHDHDAGDDEDDDVQDGSVTVTGRVVNIDEAAGRVVVQEGTDQHEVDVGDVEDVRVGDRVTAEGELGEDGTIDGDLEDPRVDCQGAVRHIKDAGEKLSSSAWKERAQFAEQTEKMWKWWNGEDGLPPD